jgi:Zn-dependent protease
MDTSGFQYLAIALIPMVLAITVHEAAHAFAANHFGDSTAKALGRMTLNPVKHIDPLGTLLLPALTVMFGGFFFGWAKPVPVNTSALHSPKKDMFWVAAAGPLSNLAMALLWAWFTLVPKALGGLDPDLSNFLNMMARAGVMMNLSLMALNLLPIPPLDGSRLVDRFLPPHLSYRWAQLEAYGLWIVLILAYTRILNVLMEPLLRVGEVFVRLVSPI